MTQLTFGSLFAGIGGFDLGFERAGMVCKWQVEIEDYANRVLAKHWPNVHRERDIRECGKLNLESVDVICGGFPCQDISYAGLGAGLDGERSGLFFEAIRVVRELQPRIVVLENVAALLTRGLDRVLGTLAEIGYDAEWHCIPAAAVGAPHIRDRVFVIGYRTGVLGNSECSSKNAHATECTSWNSIGESGGYVSDAVSTRAGDEGGATGRQGRQRADAFQPEALRQSDREIVPERSESVRRNVADAMRELRDRSWRGSKKTGRGQFANGCQDMADSDDSRPQGMRTERKSAGWQDPDGYIRSRRLGLRRNAEFWAVEPDVGRVANGIPNRAHRLRGLGNAVVPQVAEWIGRRIIESMNQ